MAALYDSGFAISTGTNMVSCEGPLVRSHSPQITMEKPLPSLPSLPSPTLTNPDMVLPSAGSMHIPESPESLRGPPSISYLRDITNQHAGARTSSDRSRPSPPKKEKRGLMSRKLMLLRSRTGSDNRQDTTGRQDNTGRQDFPVRTDSLEDTSTIPSSPTIYSPDHLAPQSIGKRGSISGSSLNSDDYGALPAFLSRHRSREDTESEDTDTEKTGGLRMGYSVSIAGGSDVQRRTREEEEQNSAMLSQRAEQILANAKKRLNLMEGNLRGARDLVTPLTAANLKRATSLGSSAALQPAANYGNKRFLMDGYTNTRPGSSRPLHLQISTPSLRRDYQQSHGRTNSENTLPERPHTALARGDMFGRKGRIPVRPSTSSWTDVRGSPGYDSVISPALPHESDGIPGRMSATPGAMRTPDTDLEPLPEESASQVAPSDRDVERDSAQYEPDYAYGLGIHRSPSTTDGLRGQMSSLKSRISTLRERAKEDSMRRQSFNNLRDVSPLNNAEYQPPEIWYGGQADAAGGAEASGENTPTRKTPVPQAWGSLPLKTGSRNAFAELAAKQQSGNLTLRERRLQGNPPYIAGEHGMHEGHMGHMVRGSRDMPGSFDTNDNEVLSNFGAEADGYQHSDSDAPTLDTPNNPSEYFPDLDVESVYEDAEPDLPSSIVPHEQREDAFDYENFFLHSAMARYQQSSSPPGSDCDTESISSVSTAKAPTATIREIYPSQQDDMLPPATPETPETLREIERRIAHSRSQSQDSISTSASFATAAEQHGRISPSPYGGAASKPSSRRSSRAGHFSRPSSTDPSSLPRPATNMSTSRSTSTTRRTPSNPPTSRRRSTLRRSGGPIAVASPLLPSAIVSSPVQDPTAIAVNALLDSQARCLGLKDKALVFGVVESLRRVCGRLQEGDDEEAYDLREWRRRLDSCRKALDGVAEES
jgi:hypothetical protein